MKVKQFKQWRVGVMMAIGIMFGVLMKMNLGILGLFLAVDGLILLSLLKTKVEDEAKDERLERLYEKAAAMSFMVLIPVLGITAGMVLIGGQGRWFYLQSMGMVLGYAALLGITVHLVCYWYFLKKY